MAFVPTTLIRVRSEGLTNFMLDRASGSFEEDLMLADNTSGAPLNGDEAPATPEFRMQLEKTSPPWTLSRLCYFAGRRHKTDFHRFLVIDISPDADEKKRSTRRPPGTLAWLEEARGLGWSKAQTCQETSGR